ncbi:MAG TPA: hypothetical protein VGA22_01585 [Gemmatimonadales bacterium]
MSRSHHGGVGGAEAGVEYADRFLVGLVTITLEAAVSRCLVVA